MKNEHFLQKFDVENIFSVWMGGFFSSFKTKEAASVMLDFESIFFCFFFVFFFFACFVVLTSLSLFSVKRPLPLLRRRRCLGGCRRCCSRARRCWPPSPRIRAARHSSRLPFPRPQVTKQKKTNLLSFPPFFKKNFFFFFCFVFFFCKDENLSRCWEALKPAVGRLREYYEFTQQIEASFPDLLRALCEDGSLKLGGYQALARQLAGSHTKQNKKKKTKKEIDRERKKIFLFKSFLQDCWTL